MENAFYDFIIIGAGPAGLSAAQYAARSNLSVLVIENGTTGGQALNINKLENYPGVFTAMDGAAFVESMREQAQEFGASILRSTVNSIDKIGQKFVLETESGRLSSWALLIATGAEHQRLGVPGEDKFAGRGVSWCATCDGPFFKNKRILVVGGGDSACDEATYLSTLSPYVTLVHRRGSLRAQKAVADRVLSNKNITVQFFTQVKEIKGVSKVDSVVLADTRTGETREMQMDGIFEFVGMKPRTDLVEMLRKDEKGYIITNYNMETSIKGMFCAGDIRAKPFRQIVTATADGATAAYSAGQYIRNIKNEAYI